MKELFAKKGWGGTKKDLHSEVISGGFIGHSSLPVSFTVRINEGGVMDFMSDSLYCSNRFKTSNIIPQVSGNGSGCLSTSRTVTRIFLHLKEERGLPKYILVNNEPELISDKQGQFCTKNEVTLNYIQPRKPQQNRFIEHFNDLLHREFLNVYLYESLSQVKEIAKFGMLNDNQSRTHESLDDLPLGLYWKQQESSNQDRVK